MVNDIPKETAAAITLIWMTLFYKGISRTLFKEF